MLIESIKKGISHGNNSSRRESPPGKYDECVFLYEIPIEVNRYYKIFNDMSSDI